MDLSTKRYAASQCLVQFLKMVLFSNDSFGKWFLGNGF